MANQISQEFIEKIKNSLANIEKYAYPEKNIHYVINSSDLIKEFQEKLDKVNKEKSVYYVKTTEELDNYLKSYIKGIKKSDILIEGLTKPIKKEYKVGITSAYKIIAETGTIILDIKNKDTIYASLLVDTHIVIASKNLLIPTLNDFYDTFIFSKDKLEIGNYQILITGASQTADIEKILVMPAHGPKSLKVFITDFKFHFENLRWINEGD